MEVMPLLLASMTCLGMFLIVQSTMRNDATPTRTSNRNRELVMKLRNLPLKRAGLITLLGALIGWVVFGGFLAPLAVGMFAGAFPIADFRKEQQRQRAIAADEWPRLIDEIRLQCTTLGKSLPHALFAAGRNSPPSMQTAFREAEREWTLTTDFHRATVVLRQSLTDTTADIVCETLSVAHGIGGHDVAGRLQTLSDDRRTDAQFRRDAQAKLAGAVFARRFVIVVPAGMALAGLSIGDGRSTYATLTGQLGVTVGIWALAACWWWSGMLMRLPDGARVQHG